MVARQQLCVVKKMRMLLCSQSQSSALPCLGPVAFTSDAYRARVHMNRARVHIFTFTQVWFVKRAKARSACVHTNQMYFGVEPAWIWAWAPRKVGLVQKFLNRFDIKPNIKSDWYTELSPLGFARLSQLNWVTQSVCVKTANQCWLDRCFV